MYEAQLKNLEKARLAKKPVFKVILFCNNCGKQIEKYPRDIKNNNFCSHLCSNRFLEKIKHISETKKGSHLSETTKNKLKKYRGTLSKSWKGGKPKCKDCQKTISYEAIFCNSCKAKHFTKEHRKNQREKTSLKMIGKMPANIQRSGKFGNVKRGWYKIGSKKMFFRSKWEANYALYLNFLKREKQIKKWQYEKDVFIFEKIQFGTRSYRPDFKIFNLNGSIEYHEIKGFMDRKSVTKIKRMSIYYPNIKLIVIDKYSYNDIKNKVGRVCGFY